MLLNLNTFSIENFVLSAECSLPDGSHSFGCYLLNVLNGKVSHIHVRLSEFYSKGDVFEGELLLGNCYLSINDGTQPEHIKALFSHHIEHWDDGVEVNYQYLVDGIELEFSWHYLGKKLIANYIALETES
ncbi:TPA: hypothetical protein NKB37_002942 [Vibrio parahaemolyticus]|uniref:hypothetical protein n=1 Tax=Vibrio parahaemolyticus TaxID=670 RepID=UPI0007063DE3|nr:hypothetical protein [Vibrio parahaemolyticus]ALG52131.1 hypothetical protein FORC6_1805 [Vibrio parahaemolyticus]MBE4060322.1 hypothetical protein [Vibrio parahaemolyticus]MBE4125089.1 hypothetical protein [Vibrio parahaemolyticus]MBE4156254.1 hypothetical protein [Vibrio parahaemolyticus]MBE4445232.1 hypothetical protein [Vibrio parahaemolyticus]